MRLRQTFNLWYIISFTSSCKPCEIVRDHRGFLLRVSFGINQSAPGFHGSG